jgi:isopenicillin N synthase-like dioxygenase
MSSAYVPTLDISELESDPEVFIERFGAAYQEWGFAGITGHNINQATIDSAMKAAQWFFDLPLQEKENHQKTSSWARGYVPFGTEKAKGAKHSDLKEFYHLGRERASTDPLGANVWPNNSEFVDAYRNLYQALDQLSVKILRAVALFLSLDTDYFTENVAQGEALLRILHYPPILDADAPNVRAAAHEDINLITLLVGSEKEGLEVLNRQGKWVPISMIKGTIICNLGDMMQRLTNGLLPSTTHRVVNPKGDAALQSRYSIPFFVHPEPSMSLASLPQCCTKSNPKQFDDISAGDYHRQRLTEIGLGK